MSDQFLGETRLFSFNFAPRYWAVCAGQVMSIQQNQPLFSLLGTTYGGDGIRTFNLPDLRGRAPLSQGSSTTIGSVSGVESVALSTTQLPSHNHLVMASTAVAATNVPAATVALASAQDPTHPVYTAPANLQPMSAAALGSVGTSQPHSNTQPSLVINFCIALNGIFPSRS